MNIFEVVVLNVILILFPLIVYNLFLATNKNIKDSIKKILFSFCIITSWYLIYRYCTKSIIVNLLLLNSLVLIGYLKKYYYIANIIALLNILGYTLSLNYLFLMIIPYLFLIIIDMIKQKKKISDFIYIDLFLFVYYVIFISWIRLFNFHIYLSLGITNLIILMILNYIMIHVIYFLYNAGECIIKYHMDYKELQREKQIRLALFKITHEIKNPIAVIKAYLDMLNVNNKEQVCKYIPIIRGEIDRLLSMLQDFMLVNKDSIEKDMMDINMLIEEVIESLNPLLKQNNIEFIPQLIDDEIIIDGDYKRLSQVLINIIKNSIEAMDKRDKSISINEFINESEIKIVIKDNGSGISSENLKKLKTPFYTTKQRGTGLGVSLSDEIIKAHDGIMNYESEEGIGTSVIIKLPLCKEGMI